MLGLQINLPASVISSHDMDDTKQVTRIVSMRLISSLSIKKLPGIGLLFYAQQIISYRIHFPGWFWTPKVGFFKEMGA